MFDPALSPILPFLDTLILPALPPFLTVSFAFWVHNLSPFLIRFNENFGIRYYGLAYLLGFLSSGWLLLKYHRAGRSPLEANAIFDLMTTLIAGVILGGRFGYFILYQHEYLLRDPLVLFRVWEGGMSSHGGMLGVALALWVYTRNRPLGLLLLSDLVISTAPLGLFFGRLANFINGELWGETTRVPWGVIFEGTGGGPFPRHPSQLYEAALEGIFLFCYVQARFWKSPCTKLHPGQLTGEFLLLYALVRSFGEIYREPDAGLILGLSRGTFYSMFLVAAGLILIAYARRPPSQRKA